MLKNSETAEPKGFFLSHLPDYLLLLIVVLTPFDQIQRNIFLGMSLQRMVFIFLTGLFCIRFLVGNHKIDFTPLIIPLMLYFISHFFGAFQVQPAAAVTSLFRVLGYVFLFVMAANIPRSRNQITTIVLALIFSLFIIEVFSIFKMLTGKALFGLNLIQFPLIDHKPTYRLLGTSDNPNNFATLFVIVLPMLTCLTAVYKNLWMRLMLSLLFVVGLVCLLATQSRSGLLGVSGGVILTLVYFFKKGRNRRLLVLWVLVLPVMAVMSFSQFPRLNQINLGARVGDKESYKLEKDNFRIRILQSSLAFVMAHPFGAGPGKLGEKIAEYAGDAGDPEKHSPHNMFLSTGAENGWLGVISLGLLWGFIFFYLVKGIKRAGSNAEKGLILAFLSSFTAVFIHNQFHSLLAWNILWLLFGLAFGTLKISQASSHEAPA